MESPSILLAHLHQSTQSVATADHLEGRIEYQKERSGCNGIAFLNKYLVALDLSVTFQKRIHLSQRFPNYGS